MNDSTLDNIINKFSSAIETENCVAWIGSGLSINSGYPSWENFIQNILCKACGVKELPEELSSNSYELEKKADECKNKNLDIYQQTLSNTYGEVKSITRRAYIDLFKLPFISFITTNYDPLLALHANDKGINDICSYPYLPVSCLGKHKPHIFYLHGSARVNDIPTGENLILSKSEFDDAYKSTISSFLEQLFTYHSVVFFGSNLTERSIQKCLEISSLHKSRMATVSHNHGNSLCLLHDGSIYSDEKNSNPSKNLENLGIDILFYKASDKTHKEIEIIINRLCDYFNKPKFSERNLKI